MSALLENEVPFEKGGRPQLGVVLRLMDFSFQDLSKVTNLSEATLRNIDKKGVYTPSTRLKFQPVMFILNMLWELAEGDEEKIRSWLYKPRVPWKGITPIDALKLGRHAVVSDHLQRLIEGEVGGS